MENTGAARTSFCRALATSSFLFSSASTFSACLPVYQYPADPLPLLGELERQLPNALSHPSISFPASTTVHDPVFVGTPPHARPHLTAVGGGDDIRKDRLKSGELRLM